MRPTTMPWHDTATPLHTATDTLAPPEATLWRQVAARMLRAAGQALDRLALRLTTPPLPLRGLDIGREFHAQAGAPEGALYVNGQLIGHLPGLERL